MAGNPLASNHPLTSNQPQASAPFAPNGVSSYQDYLPGILQSDPFLGRFLLAFEAILTGLHIPNANNPCPGTIHPKGEQLLGLEEVISLIHTYFDCTQTPEEFLPWLSGWVALSLQDNWATATKRQFIAAIVPLYRQRGTKAALEKILQIYLRSAGFQSVSQKAQIIEFEDPPHFFQVSLTLPNPDPNLYWQQARIAQAIIDQEKPAHTFYALKILVPTMQIRGAVYPLILMAPGQIIVDLIQTGVTAENTSPLSLKIKGGTHQTNVYAQTTGGEPLQASHEVTVAQFEATSEWHISVANLSPNPVEGTLTIQYPGEAGRQSLTQTFSLGPGLRIGRPPAGNTILGNTEGHPAPLPSNPA
jgi:phage tail-like protein